MSSTVIQLVIGAAVSLPITSTGWLEMPIALTIGQPVALNCTGAGPPDAVEGWQNPNWNNTTPATGTLAGGVYTPLAAGTDTIACTLTSGAVIYQGLGAVTVNAQP